MAELEGIDYRVKLIRFDNGLDAVARQQESGKKGTAGCRLGFGPNTWRNGDVTTGGHEEKKWFPGEKSTRKSIATFVHVFFQSPFTLETVWLLPLANPTAKGRDSSYQFCRAKLRTPGD